MNKPIPAGNRPKILEMEPGKYAWCSCGRSAKQPFCDGSHQGTGLTPVLVTIDKTRNVAWCACKQSAAGAFCDGTHEKF